MTRPLRVALVLVLAAVAATALWPLGTEPLGAQNPPRPPHQYYGDGGADSAAQIDGTAPPEGTLIVARDASGIEVGRTTVTETHWLIQVSEEDADAVSFEFLGCAGRTQTFPIESGGLTAVLLEASGCEPTIDRAALATAEPSDARAGADAAEPRDLEGPAEEPEQATADLGTAAEAAGDAAATPIPASEDGSGVDAWIWVVLGLLFGAGAIGAVIWIRRPLDRSA